MAVSLQKIKTPENGAFGHFGVSKRYEMVPLCGFRRLMDSDSENKWTVFRGFRNECPNSVGIGVQIVPE
ncbi:MAG: hypothetical protein A2020_13890 [Lentisphaerae bacterium GWF2_45_14]|nr:MAG: hypothetical protein A2020_13890 [Lentisphaerae bacterium GWF2_45_14]